MSFGLTATVVVGIPSLGSWDALARLVLACALGAAIGFEREIRDREAGIRTHLLVSLGSALFTIISAYGFKDFLTGNDQIIRADPSRIAAQVVTGIGFLGAGAIMRNGSSIRGLTTAATLWVVAAIGMACGAGYYLPAIAVAALTLGALWPLRLVAYRLVEHIKPARQLVSVELSERTAIGELLSLVQNVAHLEVRDEASRWIVDLEIPDADNELVARMADQEFVVGVTWGR